MNAPRLNRFDELRREQTLNIILRRIELEFDFEKTLEALKDVIKMLDISPEFINALASYRQRTNSPSGDIAISDLERKYLNVYWEKWRNIISDTGVLERERIEALISNLYRYLKRKPPAIIFCESPLQLSYYPHLVEFKFRNHSMELERSIDFDRSVLRINTVNNLEDNIQERFWQNLHDQLQDAASGLGDDLDIGRPIGDELDHHLLTALASRLRKRAEATLTPDLCAALHLEQAALDPTSLERIFINVTNSLLDRDNIFLTAPSAMHLLADCRGLWNVFILIKYGFVSQFIDPKLFDPIAAKQLEMWLELVRYTPACRFFQNACFVAAKPLLLSLDDRARLHHESSAAACFEDGYKLFAINGVLVPCHVVEKPDEMTVEQIERTANAEIRNVMISRYGLERYIKDSKIELVHSDQYGNLYKKDGWREPVTILHVVNSTAEPDGTRKNYFLMVPPMMQTAKEAVAWTFTMPAHLYNPTVET